VRKWEFIPEKFVGKGGKGYMLKEWIVRRGHGAASVTQSFKKSVIEGERAPHKLKKKVVARLKAGPRIATWGMLK
jgi:hypothetical protein